MAFPNLTYVFLDTEGTSRSKTQNDLIEFSLITGTLDQLDDPITSLVKPTHAVPPIVSRLTGITTAQLKHAPSFKTVVPKIRSVLANQCLVGHNIQCDIDLINLNLKRLNQPPLDNQWLDTQTVAKLLLPAYASYQLRYLKDRLAMAIDISHRATDDAMSTWHLLRHCSQLLQSGPAVMIHTMLRVLSPKSHPMLYQFIQAHQGYHADLQPYTHYITGFDASYHTHPDKPVRHTDMAHCFQSVSTALGYTHRESQVAMAVICDEAMRSNQHTVIESPTGTGKSLAYLVPSILQANRSKEPVIIVTKTKLLQEQLMQTLSELENVGLPEFSYMIIKGKQNYISLPRFDDLLKHYLMGQTARKPVEFLGLFYWLLHTKTGDLSELHPELHQLFHERVCHQPDDLIEPSRYCFLTTMRQAAKKTSLLITNHALFFSDQHTNAGILPKASAIVIDEAHGIETSVESYFSYTLSFKHLNLYPSVEPIARLLQTSLQETNLSDTQQYLAVLCDELDRLKTPHTTPNDSPPDTRLLDLHRTCLAFKSLPAYYTHWITGSTTLTWHAAPLSCPSCISGLIQTTTPIIFTSATLSVGASFNHFLDTVGLDTQKTQTHQLPAVFDYQRQAKAYWGLPAYTDHDLCDYLSESQTNTLILFTAFEALKQFYSYSKLHVRNHDIIAHRIHGGQGAIMKRFKLSHRPAILLGLDTFWEGIDLPGNQVNTVILYKLPFLAPSNPITAAKLQAIDTAGNNSFMTYLLPKAILKFKQGIGRLIRRSNDSGTLIIWDHRIITKSYGQLFLNELSDWPCEPISDLIKSKA